ncbi:hypothetical protein CYLTODRAFT_494991 [Cylindrobasidium torrendii FP15055 ss-10]|uniref:RRM domain-containing protein n=1 Tax=Cylindrobasidium torrendii FP15055 ss-10 TaxID=1314674 RepID=A0A0D7AUI5_9AGAR|nr:hypothetical protein CYLTODRAFT_494991 [Cylindrobasidium torrendii FP15055 ss-10]
MSTFTVNVKNIAPETTEAHLNDFFTFCGTITSIEYKQDAHAATIHFEKPSAAKTALMLNGGSLDGATLDVTSDIAHADEPEGEHKEGAPLEQSDKPRAAIAAEYLAKGYQLSDQILHRAIDLDNQQGISKRFLAYFHSIDATIGAKALGPDQKLSTKVQETVTSTATRAKTIDEQKGYTKTASEYYFKALSSPLGQKVKSFYTDTSKQLFDIHEEAKRLSEAKKAEAAPAEATPAPAPAAGASATTA